MSKQCKQKVEERWGIGNLVHGTHRCRNRTNNPSGYCHMHQLQACTTAEKATA